MMVTRLTTFVYDNPQYEVIDGEIVELPPMRACDVDLSSRLGFRLYGSVEGKTGRVQVEMLYDMGIPGRQRRPDVSFVSYERWPADQPVPRTNAWQVVPNLAVEVVSPSNTGEDVLVKVNEYFKAGVERVWVIWPSVQQVYAYQAATQVSILTVNDELAEPILPGFGLKVARLFETERT